MDACYLLAILCTIVNQHRPKTPLFSDDLGCFVMLEEFEMVEDLEAPIVPNDVAPRNDTDVDGYGDCFSAIEYSPKHRSRRILAGMGNTVNKRAAMFFNVG